MTTIAGVMRRNRPRWFVHVDCVVQRIGRTASNCACTWH